MHYVIRNVENLLMNTIKKLSVLFKGPKHILLKYINIAASSNTNSISTPKDYGTKVQRFVTSRPKQVKDALSTHV